MKYYLKNLPEICHNELAQRSKNQKPSSGVNESRLGIKFVINSSRFISLA